MKFIKRIIGLLVVLIIILLLAAVAIPYFFKDKVVDKAKVMLNEQVDANIEFADVNLSFFKSFPQFSVCIENYAIEGKGEFEKINLATGEEACITTNFWSIIKAEDKIKVNSIYLNAPNVNLVINKNGKANYEIYQSSGNTETETANKAYELNLDKYQIANGSFSYFDKSSSLYMHAENIDHEGTGNLTQTVYDLITETTAEQVTFSTGGINYINKADLDLDAIFNIDLDNQKYVLKDNDLKLNALKTKLDGFIQMVKEDVQIDLKLKAPNNSLKELISLVPGAYTKDFNNVQAEGQVALDGYIKGTYNKRSIPSFSFDVKVDNGQIKYPGMPLGISNVNTKFNLTSPGQDIDQMVLNMPQFSIKIGDNPLAGKMILKTILSDPNIDTEMKGTLDLAEFAKAFPLEDVSEMKGIIDANFKVNSSLSLLESGKYDQVDMGGTLAIKDLLYRSQDYPLVKIKGMAVDFLPQFLKINQFDAILGKSDLKASGKIDNFLAYFSPEKTMKGDLSLESGLFDLNEWMAEEPEKAAEQNSNLTDEEAEVFDRFDFNLVSNIDKLIYGEYNISNFKTAGHFTPNKMAIDLVSGKLLSSTFSAKGDIKNTYNYLFNNEVLTGNLSFNADVLNLNEFMEEDTGAEAKAISSEENLDPYLVPANVKMDLTADIGKVIYTDIELDRVKGKVNIADEKITMNNVKGKSMGGQMNVNGSYDTKEIEDPSFKLDYKISKMDFKQAFQKFNTFQFIMPIGQYLDGKFSTDMSFNGKLGKDMMPDLNSLTADGFLQTFDALIKNSKILEELGSKMNISFLKNLKLENTKNWFTVKDGKVVLAESTHNIKGIEMLVDGSHGFDQEMNYKIKAKVPRKLFGSGTAGKLANKGLDLLNKEASKLGVKISDGDIINVLIKVTGSALKPKINITPLGAEGETVKELVDNVVNTVKDSVETVVKEKIDDTKDKARAEKQRLEAEAEAKIKAIKDRTNSKVESVRAAAKRRAHQAKETAYAEADKAVEKVGNNPIKKALAQKAAEVAKKEADKVYRGALSKVDDQTDRIKRGADAEINKVRAAYDKKIKDVEKKAGL